MKAILFDVDGTLANCEHRVHHVQNGNRDWNKFFAEMHLDTPVEPVVWLTKVLADYDRLSTYEQNRERVAIIVVTARPDNYRVETKSWFVQHGVRYDKMYMRKENDHRQDAIVKQEILEQIMKDGYEPFLVIDDRQQVVDMWRSFGITTLQCAPDNTHSKYAGETLLHMMVGPSGAGKSTYIKKNYKPHDVISTDQIRLDLFGSFGSDVQSPEHHARVFSYAHGLIETRLKNGVFTVFDATNLRDKDRKAVLKHVPGGQLVQYVIIDREFDEKLRTRDWRPEELVRRHHNTFKSNLKNILAGDHQPNVYVLDMREHKV